MVYLRNCCLPFGYSAKVSVEQRQVNGTESIGSPRLVDERTASKVERLMILSETVSVLVAGTCSFAFTQIIRNL